MHVILRKRYTPFRQYWWLRIYRGGTYWRRTDASRWSHSNGAQGILAFAHWPPGYRPCGPDRIVVGETYQRCRGLAVVDRSLRCRSVLRVVSGNYQPRYRAAGAFAERDWRATYSNRVRYLCAVAAFSGICREEAVHAVPAASVRVRVR